MSETLFLRLLSYDDKSAALADSIKIVLEGRTLGTIVNVVNPKSFGHIPGSTFAYWVSERIRAIFMKLPAFESKGRTLKQGLATADDLRFARLWWEVKPENAVSGTLETEPEQFHQQTYLGRHWVPFAKGGTYSPFYSDIHLVVNWEQDGEALKEWICQKYEYLNGKWEWVVKNSDFYFYPGLTWPRRTQRGLSVRVLPAGCIFSDKGPVIFSNSDSLYYLLGIANSIVFQGLVALQMAFGSFEVGVIQRTAVPEWSEADGANLMNLTLPSVNIKRNLDTANEISHIFHLPALLQAKRRTLLEGFTSLQVQVKKAQQQLTEYEHEIDDIAFKLYGITDEDRQAIEESLKVGKQIGEIENVEVEVDDDDSPREGGVDTHALITDLLSYTIGCVFGRWDICFAVGKRETPELPDPFAPLPVCSPGMLTGDDNLPLSETLSEYPIDINWEGILVDDPDHPDVIVCRVQDVLKAIWQDNAESIEQEACQVLGVKELRDYFRRPGNDGFWMDHVKRYSKSRRKAPIYWLLQSSKRSYALWLYYHRLDKDILFKALTKYVEPKIRLEENRLEQTRTQLASFGTAGREVKQLERQFDRQENLVGELYDFRDKLRRVANLHLEPDLNDGVVLNIAPLWELVPWGEAKKYWEELLAGKYEWSSISKQLRAKGVI